MAVLFVAGMAERLAAARAALGTGDRAALAAAAHGLRSSCAQFGAETAAGCCQALEDAAGREAAEVDGAALAALVDRTDGECAAYRRWLEGELAGGTVAGGRPEGAAG
jgi:HPt (histidine-containing phosphotransfer) domain-containing protein